MAPTVIGPFLEVVGFRSQNIVTMILHGRSVGAHPYKGLNIVVDLWRWSVGEVLLYIDVKLCADKSSHHKTKTYTFKEKGDKS